MRSFAITLIVAVAAAHTAWPVSGQTTSRPAQSGVYSPAQAVRGKALYTEHCGSCHGTELEGGAFGGDIAPPLKRDDFLASGDLGMTFTGIRKRMPLDSPGILADQIYIDIVAFLLEQNGFPPGGSDLPFSAEQLSLIRLVKAVPLKTGSFVQFVGCLQREGDAWSLVHADAPIAAAGPVPTASDIAEAQGQSLGKQTITLVNVDAGSAVPASKVMARGLLILMPTGKQLNIAALRVVAPVCP